MGPKARNDEKRDPSTVAGGGLLTDVTKVTGVAVISGRLANDPSGKATIAFILLTAVTLIISGIGLEVM